MLFDALIEYYKLGYLTPLVLAYKDRENYVIDDIPLDLLGARTLKTNLLYQIDTINFTVNKQVNIFIAIPDTKYSFLDDEFII